MTLMQGLGPGGVLAKNVNDMKNKTSQKNFSQNKARKNFNKAGMMKTVAGSNSQSFDTDLNFKAN